MVAQDQRKIQDGYDRLAHAEPLFAELIARVGAPDPFEFPDGGRTTGSNFGGMVMHILAQQISARVALVLYDRLVIAVGGSLTPDAVLGLGIDQVKAIGTSHSKATYVTDLAEAVSTGQLDIENLTDVGDEEAEESLTRVKGIGPWSAEMFLIHQLRRGDILPAGDLGIRAAIRSVYSLDDVPSIEDVRRIGQPWSPYRTYAAALLWRSLVTPSTGGKT